MDAQEQLEHRRRLNRKYVADFKRRNPERMKEIQAGTRRRRIWKTKAYFSNRRSREAGIPGEVTAEHLREIYLEQDGLCFYCGKPIDEKKPNGVWLDHVLPLSNPRSTNDPTNIVLCCRGCSSGKSKTHPSEWVLKKLLKKLADNLKEQAGVS